MAPGCGLLFVNPGYLYEIHCVGSDERPCEQERIDESAEINLACSDVTPMSNDTKNRENRKHIKDWRKGKAPPVKHGISC